MATGEMRAHRDGALIYIPPASVPILAIASDGQQTFLTGGGGGSTASKEVPNVVQAHRYDEAAGQVETVATFNTEKSATVHLSYSPSSGLWLASCGTGCKVLEFSADQGVLREVCWWSSETGDRKPEQNVARCSPAGDLAATGGTDGVVRIWRVVKPREEPILKFSCAKYKEVTDLDFSPDGKLLASCDDTGACRIWDTVTGDEKVAIKYAGPQGPLTAQKARFVASAHEVSPALLIAGRGQMKKPSYLGLFAPDGRKLSEAMAGKEPLNALEVDHRGQLAAVNFLGDSITKRVFSLPSLKCVKKAQGCHDLPALCVAMVGEDTAVSASGDRIVHLVRARGKGGGGSCSTLAYMCCLMVVLLVTFYLVLRIGIKGAALQQGAGEL